MAFSNRANRFLGIAAEMADCLSKEQRSYCMSQIRSVDTKPEILVRSFLHKKGFRFRLHSKDLPGKPDIVLPKYKTVIDVRGCFWHRHPNCRNATTPSTNADFWNRKFAANVSRDKLHERQLRKLGWRVIVVWECRLKERGYLERLVRRIRPDA